MVSKVVIYDGSGSILIMWRGSVPVPSELVTCSSSLASLCCGGSHTSRDWLIWMLASCYKTLCCVNIPTYQLWRGGSTLKVLLLRIGSVWNTYWKCSLIIHLKEGPLCFWNGRIGKLWFKRFRKTSFLNSTWKGFCFNCLVPRSPFQLVSS